jgi:hypothetical protein
VKHFITLRVSPVVDCGPVAMHTSVLHTYLVVSVNVTVLFVFRVLCYARHSWRFVVMK